MSISTKPKTLRVKVNEYGLTMEVDTVKGLCQTPPHWHLCKNGKPIAQISAEGKWTMSPEGIGIGTVYIKKAERLTAENRSKLIEAYEHNALYGNEAYDKAQ